jgi:hypothetical protein
LLARGRHPTCRAPSGTGPRRDDIVRARQDERQGERHEEAPMTSDLAERRRGAPIPAGTYTIEQWAQMLLCDVLGAPDPGDGRAHPLFAYIAPQCGMGIGVEGIFALAEADAADGPLVASCDLEILGELRVGETYQVSGEVVDVVRKEGRKTGPFDLFTFRLDLADADGEVVVHSTNVWVFPRRSSDGA